MRLPPRFQRLLLRRAPLAWSQLVYQKGKFLMASLGIASAIVLMFVQFGFLGALTQCNLIFHRHLQTDLVLLAAPTETLYATQSFSRRRLYQLLGWEPVAAVTPLYIGEAAFKNLHTGHTKTITVFGLDPNAQPWDFPEVQTQLPRTRLADTVLFDRNSRPEYGIDPAAFEAGEAALVEINGQRVNLDGLVTFIGLSFGSNGSLLTSIATFQSLFSGFTDIEQIDMGLIQLKNGADAAAIAAAIRPHLAADVQLLTREEFIALERRFWDENTTIGFIFKMGAMVGFFIGMYIVYQVLFTDIADHIPDYAILKAKGYPDRYFLSVVLQESIIFSVSSYLPGYLLSVLLYYLVRVSTNLPLVMTLSRATGVFSLTLVMSLVAGFLVTRKLKDSDPADLF